jgi:hypothetical protein
VIKDYGVFIDELYYLACASHLDWGYVDHIRFADIAGSCGRSHGDFSGIVQGIRKYI